MIDVTNASFEQEVLKSEQPVLVDFWAPWCGPCQMLMPTLEEVSNDVEGSAKVVRINIDNEPELQRQFGIMSVPTLMVFKSGEIVETLIGGRPKDEIIALLK